MKDEVPSVLSNMSLLDLGVNRASLLEPMAPLLTATCKPAEPQDPVFQKYLIMYFHLAIYPLIFKEAPSNTF